MKTVKINNHKELIYRGAYDLNDENKLIKIDAEESIEFNISDIININNKNLFELSATQLKEICFFLSIQLTIFPNGNISLHLIDSHPSGLKNCYGLFVNTNQKTYYVCIAFNETQPMVYSAALIGVLKID